MVRTASTQHFFANHALQGYVFDPDSADPVDIAWVDMNGYKGITATFVRMIGTGALDTFTFLGNTASDGTGTDRIIIAHAIGSEPNADNDQIHLEISAEDIAEVGNQQSPVELLRYVTISAEFATSTDEGCVIYVRHGPRFPRLDLTADILA